MPNAIMTPVRAALLNRIVIVLCLAGIVVAGTLTYAHYSDHLIPCGAMAGCQDVTNHSSSRWFGQPVAIYGLAAYVVLLAISLARAFHGFAQTRALGIVAYVISLVGAVTSFGLQVFSGTVIRAWCTWCIASAIIMISIFVLQAMLSQALAEAPKEESAPEPSGRKKDLAVLGIAGALTLVALVLTGMATNNAGRSTRSYVVSAADAPKLVPDDANFKGPKDAPITIVEFGDLTCPACQKAFALLNDVYKQHEGKIKVVFRHFPLMDRHPQAFRAAIYSEFAASKGRFWQFLDQVYKVAPEQVQKKEVMENILAGLNLDIGEAEKRLSDQNSPEFNRVYRDMEMSDSLGIVVTPTFFLFAADERPYSVTISEITGKLDSDPKYRKLLGTGGG